MFYQHSGKSNPVLNPVRSIQHILDLLFFSSSPEGKSIALPKNAQSRHVAIYFETARGPRIKKSLVVENMQLTDI